MSVIKVQALSKNFGAIKAVDQLSFEVEAGQVYGFLGQNGSGKSTTIRMLLSLIHPSEGHIEIFGQSLTDNRSAILEKVGAVIERPDSYPYLTAQEHLSLFAKLRKQKITAAKIESTLSQVGLLARANDKVQTYSLGMKQRLGIGIALLHDPQLIILDEPTNGLDPQGIADIRQLIQSLSKEEGKTVLVSSHLLSEIEQIASHILIIHQGKKMAEGPTSSLLDPNKTIVQIKTLDDADAKQKLMDSAYRANILERSEGLYLSIPKLDIPGLNTFFMVTTLLGEYVGVILVLVFLFFTGKHFIPVYLIALLITFLVSQGLKLFVFEHENRPSYTYEQLEKIEGLEHHKHHSFPSGHTSTAFAIFTILAIAYPKKGVPFLGAMLAVLVGISRIYLGQHYLSDVVTGAIIGLFTSVWVVYFYALYGQNKNG